MQIDLALNWTFMELYIDMFPVTLKNGSVIISTVFSLHDHVNISAYEDTLFSNIFDLFLDAGFLVDNSSISMNSVLFSG